MDKEPGCGTTLLVLVGEPIGTVRAGVAGEGVSRVLLVEIEAEPATAFDLREFPLTVGRERAYALSEAADKFPVALTSALALAR